MCEFLYAFIKNDTFKSIKYYNDSINTINTFSQIKINKEMNELFQILNDSYNSAKKSVTLYGSDIQFRNDTGGPITNVVKIVERKGWNGARMIQKKFEDSLGYQQEKGQTNDENTKKHLQKIYVKITTILEYLIIELIKANLKLNMYTILFELFEKYYGKYEKEKIKEKSEPTNNELKSKLINTRSELLKVTQRYNLIKQITKNYVELKSNKMIDNIINMIEIKDKKTKEFKINSNEMIVLNKSELRNKSSAINMKLVTTKIYNIKTDYNLVYNLIKDYNKKENPSLSNYFYDSLY